MTFNKIWPFLRDGAKIRRKGWGGYWAWENDTIMMHCANGDVLDIRETKDPSFTFSNIASDDWEPVIKFDTHTIINMLKMCVKSDCSNCLTCCDKTEIMIVPRSLIMQAIAALDKIPE